MKMKLLLLTVLVMAFVCLLTVSASAEVTTYIDAPARSNIQIKTDEIVEFNDGFKCPVAYVFPDISSIGQKAYFDTLLNFDYINGKTGKIYTFADVKGFDIPSGVTHVGIYAGSDAHAPSWITFPNTITSLDNAIFQNSTTLEKCTLKFDKNNQMTNFPAYMFYGCKKLEAFSMPDCFTTIYDMAHFTNCSALTAVYLSKNLTKWQTQGGSYPGTFDYCGNMYFVNEPFTYDNIPEKPDIYYFPEGLTSNADDAKDFSNQCPMRNCSSINSIIVFGTNVTRFNNAYFLQSSTVKIVFLGDMDVVAMGNGSWYRTTYYFANSADKSTDDVEISTYSESKAVFCKANGNTTHLMEPKSSTLERATCINDEYLISVCFCGTEISRGATENKATGKHVFNTNNCTESVKCSDDEECTEMSQKYENHALEKTLEYANGFDKAGKYTCVCTNATYCTVENADEEKDPIITFKGYSTPEGATYKGINAGFKINKTLLNLYESVNEDTVTFNLLMINSKIGEQNITGIMNGEDLAENVKGINIKITSPNYTNIKVEIRGFDDTPETGNFYTLNLITAIAVKTKEGTHYAQGGLKNSPNTTIKVEGVDFNIVTANQIYNSTQQA